RWEQTCWRGFFQGNRRFHQPNSVSLALFRMGQPRLGLQMLYFHQVGVALPTLISLRQSITKLRELVSIGPRTGEIACARAAARPREIGFGFIQGHWDFTNGERRCFGPLMPLQCVT